VSKRILRSGGVIVALMFGMMAMLASPVTAQDSTPAESSPAADQPVVVAGSEISWTGDWQYDAASSMEQQATFTQIDMQDQVLKLVSYGVFQDETVADPGEAIDVFSDAFFEGAGAETVQENGSGELEDGTIWRMYSFDLQGTGVSFLITATQDDEGAYVVTSLTANTPVMEETITQVQEEFTIDGDGQFFEGVDAADVTQGLSTQASPEASPASTPAA